MLLTSLLAAGSLLATTLLPAAAQQSPLQVDCSDGLGDYLNALLTVLHSNGYTQMETAIATLSETQAGYDVLEQIYNNAAAGSEYLLVPTNAAFSAGGVDPSALQPVDLYDLVAYHFVGALGGSGLAADAGTAGSGHVIMASYLDTTDAANATEKVVVNSQSQVLLTGKTAQITTTAVDAGAQSGELNGLKLYEVDSILTPPQSLAATLSALSGGSNGTSMNLYSSALTRTATFATLAALPGNATSSQVQAGGAGLTIFAPYDPAFSGSLSSSSVSDWTKVLTGMYTTKQTLYSPQFAATTSLTMASGAAVTLVTNSSGSYIVGSGGSTNSAKIIRTDILIEGGGVMHVVDRIISANILATNTNGSSATTGSTSAALPAVRGSWTSVIASSAAALVAAAFVAVW